METSKELLSEVLSYKLSYKIKVHKVIVCTGTLNYFYNRKDSRGGLFEANAYINIYELAFKCKVWAVENNRELYSSSRGHCYISNLNRNNPSNTIDHYAETEVEATIKACEYILKEINGN